jgi:hypothetical protein
MVGARIESFFGLSKDKCSAACTVRCCCHVAFYARRKSHALLHCSSILLPVWPGLAVRSIEDLARSTVEVFTVIGGGDGIFGSISQAAALVLLDLDRYSR